MRLSNEIVWVHCTNHPQLSQDKTKNLPISCRCQPCEPNKKLETVVKSFLTLLLLWCKEEPTTTIIDRVWPGTIRSPYLPPLTHYPLTTKPENLSQSIADTRIHSMDRSNNSNKAARWRPIDHPLFRPQHLKKSQLYPAAPNSSTQLPLPKTIRRRKKQRKVAAKLKESNLERKNRMHCNSSQRQV